MNQQDIELLRNVAQQLDFYDEKDADEYADELRDLAGRMEKAEPCCWIGRDGNGLVMWQREPCDEVKTLYEIKPIFAHPASDETKRLKSELIKTRDALDHYLSMLNDVVGEREVLKAQLSATRQAVEWIYNAAKQRANLDVIQAYARDTLNTINPPVQEGKKCLGCNGHGLVGNILDTDTCPFCSGSGKYRALEIDEPAQEQEGK